MDLKSFDIRTKSEIAVFLPLKDPDTKEPIVSELEDCPGFLVRGTAAKSAQDALAALTDANAKAKNKRTKALVQAIHDGMIDTALCFIVGAKNIEIDGKPISTRDEFRQILDMTFPVMKKKVDADGNAILDENGIPKFELINFPWAKQVNDFAEEQENFSGAQSSA
jgi:hypothetical protein